MQAMHPPSIFYLTLVPIIVSTIILPSTCLIKAWVACCNADIPSQQLHCNEDIVDNITSRLSNPIHIDVSFVCFVVLIGSVLLYIYYNFIGIQHFMFLCETTPLYSTSLFYSTIRSCNNKPIASYCIAFDDNPSFVVRSVLIDRSIRFYTTTNCIVYLNGKYSVPSIPTYPH